MEYELGLDLDGNVICIFEPTVGYIPVDENNIDYQKYLVDTDGGLPLPKKASKK